MRFSAPALLAIAATASAACTRDSLTAALDSVFTAAEPKVDAAVIYTVNNKRVDKLADTPFSKIKTSKWSNLKPIVVDTETCQIATLRASPEIIISLRLKVDANGAINETEFVQSVAGGNDLFEPSGFPADTPALFTDAQKPSPPPQIPAQWTEANGMFNNAADLDFKTCNTTSGAARLWTRKELIYAASSYVDGMKGEPFDKCVLQGSSCPRLENGIQTAENCGAEAGLLGFTSKGRRYLADTETGDVLGIFYFENDQPETLFVHEYFKVLDGTLRYALAALTSIPQTQAASALFS